MKIRAGIVIINDNKILLMKYNYNGNDVHCIPGGNPDDKETLEGTLRRELKEELDIDIKVLDLLFIGEILLNEKKEGTLHCIFSGKIINGTPEINSAHTTSIKVEWIDMDKIESTNIYPNIVNQLANLNKIQTSKYIGRIEQKWF